MKNEKLAKRIVDLLGVDIPLDYDFNKVELALVYFHQTEDGGWKYQNQLLKNEIDELKQKLSDCEHKKPTT